MAVKTKEQISLQDSETARSAMTLHIVSTKQLISSVVSIIIAIAVVCWLVKILTDYLDLPEVYMSQDNACLKVINFKNGDVYGCQDKDVTLRRYITVHVK